MKIIKRDGRAVEYNREKIEIAIEKANKEVRQVERATKQEIKEIITYIEELGKKRMLVEDIQDIIERKLMEINRYELAKKYIVYRYTRALVRKQNTTDESILGLIRNGNQVYGKENGEKTLLASAQRDYIAGEVSQDLTKRLLLPEKIVKADSEEILYFHNSDYFVQPIINSCIVNLSDMLDNGTVINEKLIETPKSFKVACIVMTQIIAVISSNQYGTQTIDLMDLGKYLRKSADKLKNEIEEKYKDKMPKEILKQITQERLKDELKSGIQTILYQINTSIFTGKIPSVRLLIHIEKEDSYIKENAMITEEILKQMSIGIKNDKGEYVQLDEPQLLYVLNENNKLNNSEYSYLTELALKCKVKFLDFQNDKTSCLQHTKKELFAKGKFNQGVVSINLKQIGLIADGNEEIFWKELDERLELCREALMCRHYALIGTKSDISPLHWQYGAISRLEKGEKINKLLMSGYSNISLGYVGLDEAVKLMTDEQKNTEANHKFEVKLINYLNDKVKKWSKETGVDFILDNSCTYYKDANNIN